MPQNKVLITGGNGLVGSAIKLSDSIHVGSKDADLRDMTNVKILFQMHKPTHVIHCAAKVGGVKANMDRGGEFYRDNVLISTNIIEACRIYNVEKIVNFSSTCVFPDKVKYPLTVDQIFDGPPHPSNAPYAYAKRGAMVQLEAYKNQYGLKYATIIPCNIYGPNDNYNSESSHVIPALIRKCWEAKKNGSTFKIWGSGKPIREFIFSKDVARYAEEIIFDDFEGSMIVSSGLQWEIKKIAEVIAEKMGYDGEIEFDESLPDGQFKKPSDYRLCCEYRRGKFGLHSFSEGLDTTIKDFLEREKKNTLRN